MAYELTTHFRTPDGTTYRATARSSDRNGAFDINWEAYKMVDGWTKFVGYGNCPTEVAWENMRMELAA